MSRWGMRALVPLSLVVAAFGYAPVMAQQPAPLAANPTLRTVPLTIRSSKGARRFHVEVAMSGDEQERGLMFRKHLGHDAGMIFPMAPPRTATFWMKNTLIPLDLVFIRADGTIARVAADAQPLSLSIIDSGEPVASVLELTGGEAALQGIRAGDRVSWRAPRR